MKKVLMILVCLMAMVVSVNANSHYPTYTVDGITYVSSGRDKEGDFIRWEVLKVDKPYDRTIVVPSKIMINGKEQKISKIREGAFSSCTSLDSLIISDGIFLGSCNTFKGCKTLEYLYYSNGGYCGKYGGKDLTFYGLSCKTFETVDGVGDDGFWKAIKSSLEKLIIRDTQKINTRIDICQNLKTIICYATNPPYSGAARNPYTYICASANITFEKQQCSTITLYVPRESLEKYYFHNIWGEIDNIYALDEMNDESESNSMTSSVNSITDNIKIDNSWYTLDGTKVVNPTKGVYIKNGKKYVIK